MRRRRQHAASRPADAARDGNDRRGNDAGDDRLDDRHGHGHGVHARHGVRGVLGEARHERGVFGEARDQRVFVGEARDERAAQEMKRAIALALLFGCASASPPQKTFGSERSSVRHLDAKIPGFLPENRARIDAMLDELHGKSRVAVFDWDNTMMRNDIGDATFFYMLRHDLILQPPARDWAITSKHLTAASRAWLNAACDAIAEPGKPLPTSRTPACADALLAIYDDGKARDGSPAFDADTKTMHHSYAWGAQLQAGHSPDEMRAIARRVYDENASAPIDATQTVGTRTVAAWVRIYQPMRDLVAALKTDGFDVWVVSASAQPLVEIVAEMVGVDASHVVGIRTIDYRIRGCGTEPDGADTVITFNEGKRCWINKAIFKLPESEQLSRAADPMKRPAFAAGDSDTDLAMVEDATSLHLTIDRNKHGLMCAARANADGRWLVQPMFIEPLPPHELACP